MRPVHEPSGETAVTSSDRRGDPPGAVSSASAPRVPGSPARTSPPLSFRRRPCASRQYAATSIRAVVLITLDAQATIHIRNPALDMAVGSVPVRGYRPFISSP